MNELMMLADSLQIDFGTVSKLMKLDARIGESHLQVPGPDGSYGFGGACFPKDTAALLKVAEDHEVELSVLSAAVKKNTFLRLK